MTYLWELLWLPLSRDPGAVAALIAGWSLIGTWLFVWMMVRS